jgi:hypothetical protein
MAKRTKQQEIDELEERVNSLVEQNRRLNDKYGSFVLKLQRVIDCHDDEPRDTCGGFNTAGPAKIVSQEGIIRQMATLAERERLYHTELKELKVKYHELVRGLAKMPEKAAQIDNIMDRLP